MNFTDLYRCANSLGGDYIPFDALTAEILQKHNRVGTIGVIECDLNKDVSFGHLNIILGNVVVGKESLDEVQIRVDRNIGKLWRRVVCFKELAHLFDSNSAKANTEQKFFKLLRELEQRPLPEDASLMLQSEDNAEWRSVLLLCPVRLRKKYKTRYAKCAVNYEEMAGELKIPVGLINSIMGDYYETALEKLTGERLNGA